MTEQQNETAPATTEEKAPELPKTEPPTDDAPQVIIEVRTRNLNTNCDFIGQAR